MKIKIGDTIYLQKYDVAYILDNLNNFPTSLLQDIFDNNEKNFFFISNFNDSLRFDYIFKEPANTKWIMEQNWFINYDTYIKRTIIELKNQASCLRDVYADGINEFNAKSIDYKKEHFEEENIKYDNMHHRIISIEYLIAFREGKIEFVFPDKYQNTTTSGIISMNNRLNTTSTSDTTKVAKKNRKPDFLTRLFDHGAQ